jgi:hypothetical protein
VERKVVKEIRRALKKVSEVKRQSPRAKPKESFSLQTAQAVGIRSQENI